MEVVAEEEVLGVMGVNLEAGASADHPQAEMVEEMVVAVDSEVLEAADCAEAPGDLVEAAKAARELPEGAAALKVAEDEDSEQAKAVVFRVVQVGI